MNNTNYKYYDLIACLFVAVLLISNIVSVKISQIGQFAFDSGTILFPIAYIFGDILTEVYGYAKSRKIIWMGFISLIMMAITMYIVQNLPPAGDWPLQAEYDAILGFVPRLVLASICAYLVGEFVNSVILAKLKVKTQGKYLWMRTISSTIVGQAADSTTFTLIAFYGVLPLSLMFNVMGTIYVFKVLYEIAATPITYKIVNFLKRVEGVDYYDKDTNFTPFKID
jgi:uncharacterized integral membrane protein (TIGR00697 family)